MPAKNKTIKCNDGTLYTTGDNDGKKNKTGWMNLTAFKVTIRQVSSGVRGSQM